MKNNGQEQLDTAETIVKPMPEISPGEIIIGTLVEINALGEPCVDFPGNPSSAFLKAISTIGMTKQHIGKQVALLFANGNLSSPVIMGVIHNPLQEMLENFNPSHSETLPQKETTHDTSASLETSLKVDDVLIDGKKITFEAHEQIVLKCGESSITLTRAGKILIRGKYLLNRSTGVNRIMGGSVQVN